MKSCYHCGDVNCLLWNCHIIDEVGADLFVKLCSVCEDTWSYVLNENVKILKEVAK